MNESQPVASAQARSSRASDRPVSECFICQKSLFISFFFDAMGHDRFKDEAENRLSSLARLFRAHREKREEGVYRYYYEGLGTDLRGDSGMAAAAREALKETGKSLSKETGKQVTESAKDAASSVVKDVAMGQSPTLSGRAAMQALPDEVFKQLRKPGHFAEGVGQAVLSKVIDIFPQWRDSKISAATLNTGARARLDKALADFDATLAAQSVPIFTVQIAVFGAERGASLARAFVNELIEKRCKRSGGKLWLKSGTVETELAVKFVGLFDAQAQVAEFGKEYMLVGGLKSVAAKAVGFFTGVSEGGSLRDNFKLDLTGHVQRVVHFVAGNETRIIAALDTLAKSKAQSVEEVVFPGSQADTIGGLAPRERERHVDLARIPARKMLYEAQAAGVPVYTPHQLETISQIVSSLFELPTRVTPPGRSEPVGVATLFQAWRSDTRVSASGPLEDALLAAQKGYVSYLRIQHAVHATLTSNRAAHQAETLHIRKIYNEAKDRALLDAWVRPQELSAETLTLFAEFVHPAALGWTNDVTLQNLDVMTVRPTTGDEGLLDKIKPGRDKTPAEEDAAADRIEVRRRSTQEQAEAARRADRERAGITGYGTSP